MKKFCSSATSVWLKCSYLKRGGIVFIFSLGFFSAVNSVQAQPYGSLGWCSAAPCNGTLSVTRPGRSCSPGSGPATNCPAALACRPTDSIWSSPFPCGQCAPEYSGSAIYVWEGNVTCDSGGTSGGSTSARCGPAAKSYAYTDTAYSGLLCGTGSSPTVGNNNVPFPAPGATVTWTCFNSSSPSVNCSASRASAPITCGSANGGTFSSTSGPSAANLCSDGSRPTVSARYTGSYWTGWSWTCGSNTCSANLSPGVCGSANGTNRSSAPSTATELCQAGSPSSVSGSGPWTWSCTGTSCRADKAVSSCTPNCPSLSGYCTTTPVYDTNCGTYCGNGTVNCSVSRFIVCPASVSLSPSGQQQLNAKYWSSLSYAPSCSTTGYSTVTTSAAWSSSDTSIATVDNSTSKGLVTAGSPSVTSTVPIRAIYGTSSATSNVTVTAVSTPTPSLVVCPSSASIALGQTRSDFTAWYRADGEAIICGNQANTDQNVTSSASWSSADPSMVEVVSKGSLRGVDVTPSGSYVAVTATYSAVDATTQVEVVCAEDPTCGGVRANTCTDDQCLDSCGKRYYGTKDCREHWQEVAP